MNVEDCSTMFSDVCFVIHSIAFNLISYNYSSTWNILMILLSLTINVFMLATWAAPLAADEVSDQAQSLPSEITE